jgi:hypothetical protein
MIAIAPPRITSVESPRQILFADFESLGGELPIRGGWGYSFEDAVIIDKNDPVVPKGMPFDGVGLEYIFVEKRIYEELIIFQPKNNRYAGITWDLLEQQLMTQNERPYDVLSFEVRALPNKDWEELKAEWEGPNGYGSPGFDVDAHMKIRESRTVGYVTEYYFDMTSFFGTD